MAKTVLYVDNASDRLTSRSYLTSLTKNALFKTLTNYNDLLRDKKGKKKAVANTVEILTKNPIGYFDSVVIVNNTVTFEFDCNEYSLVESHEFFETLPKDSTVTIYNNKLTCTLGKPKYKSVKFQLKTDSDGFPYQGIYTFYH